MGTSTRTVLRYFLTHKVNVLLACLILAGLNLIMLISQVRRNDDRHSLDVLLHPLAVNTSLTTDSKRIDRLQIFDLWNISKEVLQSVSKYKCVDFKTIGIETRVCVYPAHEDMWVSGSLIRRGVFEQDQLKTMTHLLSKHPDMIVLDLGCNIGVYTIYFAKLGRRVIGVDASKRNLLLLSRSLALENLMENVTLIWNAISNVHEFVRLKRIKGNIGGTFVMATNETSPSKVVKTITLDDLEPLMRHKNVFVKLDIEQSEWKCLSGGRNFFQTVDVGYVLMEYMWHRKRKSGKQICVFMTKMGFQPYSANEKEGKRLKLSEHLTWPDNVLWSKFRMKSLQL